MPVARTVLMAAVLGTAVLAQSPKSDTVRQPQCSAGGHGGRRIVSAFGIVEFRLPRFAKVRMSAYESTVYSVRYGPERDHTTLTLVFGAQTGMEKPQDLHNSAIQWTPHSWDCREPLFGADWRGVADNGHRWRHIWFPFGSATYRDVPPAAADYFDRILDTMCCGECSTCVH